MVRYYQIWNNGYRVCGWFWPNIWTRLLDCTMGANTPLACGLKKMVKYCLIWKTGNMIYGWFWPDIWTLLLDCIMDANTPLACNIKKITKIGDFLLFLRTLKSLYSLFLLSITIVTGPSLSKATFISAAKIPVWTFLPNCCSTSWTKRSYMGIAISCFAALR